MSRTRLVVVVSAVVALVSGVLILVGVGGFARRLDFLRASVAAGAALALGAAWFLQATSVLLQDRTRRGSESIRAQASRTGRRVERLVEDAGTAATTLAVLGRRVDETAEAVRLLRMDFEKLEAALHREGELLRDVVQEELMRGAGHDGVLQTLVRNENTALYGQIEGVLHLDRLIDASPPLGPLGGFALRADLAAHLIRVCHRYQPRTVVEAGSGMSTVLFAAALRDLGAGHVTALEHNPEYADETRRLLAERGLSDRATVIDAPLVRTVIEDETYLWYDLAEADLPTSIDLLFVDGPPGSTGPQARFPAVALLYGYLSPEALVVLDDTHRSDEQAVVERWRQFLPQHSVTQIPHLVGTAEFRPSAMESDT